MKKKVVLSVCVVVAMTSSLPSHAQRLIPEQKGVEVMGSIPLVKEEKFFGKDSFGLDMPLTRYLKRENYSFVGVEYEQQNMPYRDYSVKLKDVLSQVGYTYPVLFDRGKNMLLYDGISALGGYEQLNEDKKLLFDGVTLLNHSCFVYGDVVHGSVEVFLTDKLLFLIKAQGRLLLGSDVYRFRLVLLAGLRFSF